MENNKDIGKIFRERLQGVQKTPNPKIWEAIQQELQQKKKRRIIPFWMWFAAGILLLGSGSYLIVEQGGFVKTNAIEQNDPAIKQCNPIPKQIMKKVMVPAIQQP